MTDVKHILVSNNNDKLVSFKDKLFTHVGISYLGLVLISKTSANLQITLTLYDEDKMRIFSERLINTMLNNVNIHAKLNSFCVDNTYLTKLGDLELASNRGNQSGDLYAKYNASLDVVQDTIAQTFNISCYCAGESSPRVVNILCVDDIDDE